MTTKATARHHVDRESAMRNLAVLRHAARIADRGTGVRIMKMITKLGNTTPAMIEREPLEQLLEANEVPGCLGRVQESSRCPPPFQHRRMDLDRHQQQEAERCQAQPGTRATPGRGGRVTIGLLVLAPPDDRAAYSANSRSPKRVPGARGASPAPLRSMDHVLPRRQSPSEASCEPRVSDAPEVYDHGARSRSGVSR